MKPFLFFLLAFNITSLFSQKITHEDIIFIKNDKEITDDERIIQLKKLLINKELIISKEVESDVYHYLSWTYERIESYDQAIIVLEKAIAIRQKIPNDKYKYYNSLFNLSQIYLKNNDLKEQEKVLLFLIKQKEKNKFTYYAFTKLIASYTKSGDYYKAISFSKKTIDETKDNQAYKSSFHNAYIQLISAYSFIEKLSTHQTDEVQAYEMEFNSLEDVKPKFKLAFYNNLGRIYFQQGYFKKASENYKKSLSISLENQDYESVGKIYNNIAVSHNELGDSTMANKYYLKALNITDHNIAIADVYCNQGFYLETSKSIDKDIYYNKALFEVLDISDQYNTISFLPSMESIKNSTFKLDVLSYLIHKANNFYISYEEEHKQEYLEYAKSTLYLIDEVVSMIRRGSEVEKSKLFWINKGVDTYMLAVKVCYLLNKPKEAFYFMEKNKYLLLLENLNEGEKRNNIVFRDSINEVKSSIMSLDHVMERYVSNKTNLLEYILNEESGYGIFCEKDNVHFFEIQNIADLLNELKTLKNKISAPFEEREAFDNYNAIGFNVFQKLFPFDNALQKISGKKLIVISDYKLHNFPFSTLIVKDNNTNDFLLRHTEIHYLHSTKVDNKINTNKLLYNKRVLGFSPTIFKNEDLSSLNNSEVSMKQLLSSLPLDLKLREEATKAEFFSNSKEHYSIIHINSHAGYTENEDPWLSLYDENISLETLYRLHAQTELVILDACKTNTGKQEIGEGIMSLSRAFFHSGAKSVIASQWNVNEQSNNKIIQTFYEKIKNGEKTSSALHNAKLDYINKHQLEQISPYYWASLTLTGSSDTIALKANNNIWIIVSIAIVLIVFLFVFIKKRKKQLL